MVEGCVDGRERSFDVGEVHHPTALFSYLPAHVNLDPKRVPVHPSAFMTRWHIRQLVRCLEGEFFEDLHGSPMNSVSGGWLGTKFGHRLSHPSRAKAL